MTSRENDEARFLPIPGEEVYAKLAMGEPLVLLDVRARTEYLERHIPGSILIPLQELHTRWKDVPSNGTPITVLSECGTRGATACRFLSERNISPLYNLDGGLSKWPGPTGRGDDLPSEHRFGIGPSSFLVKNFDLLPNGLALDLAMGEGRNAIYLATRGFDVDGVDVNSFAVKRARETARRLGAPIRAVVGNVEDGTYIIPIEAYDLIMVFNFLHRALFREIRDGIKPGGIVIYETFTEDQPLYSWPTNPDYLLHKGELKEVFSDWEILRYHEGVVPERPGGPPRTAAGIIARKP